MNEEETYMHTHTHNSVSTSEMRVGGEGSGRRVGEESGASHCVPSFSPPALLTSGSQFCQGSRDWTLSNERRGEVRQLYTISEGAAPGHSHLASIIYIHSYIYFARVYCTNKKHSDIYYRFSTLYK